MNRTELRETVSFTEKKDFDSTTIQGSPKSNLLIDHITVQFDLYRNNSIYEATTPLLFHDSKHPGFSHIILKDREVDNSKFLADCYHILTSSFPNREGRKREHLLELRENGDFGLSANLHQLKARPSTKSFRGKSVRSKNYIY